MTRLFTFITIHPQFITAYRSFGVFRAAYERGLAQIDACDLRDYGDGRYRRVDDVAFGGGESMVMLPEPLAKAVQTLTLKNHGRKPRVIMPSPAGRPWVHADAERLASVDEAVAIVCGRFAGIDQRFIDLYVDDEVSLGDFVVSGGELPGLMLVDSILRLIPGVLGDHESAIQDSFAEGFMGGLEHPLYTRPAVFEGVAVPEVLLSGHHGNISAWRQQAAAERTLARRPDLIGKQQKK